MQKIAKTLLKKPLYLGIVTFFVSLFMSITPLVLMYINHTHPPQSITELSPEILNQFFYAHNNIFIYTLVYAFIIATIVSFAITLLAYSLRKSYLAIEQLSHHDGLTGLYNRLVFVTLFEKEIAKIPRTNHKLFLIILDIDDFKPINDHYGHLVGDEAIKYTAHALRSILRTSDTIARFGGDEFVISVVDQQADAASGIINRILEQFNTASITLSADQELQIYLSIGYTAYKPGDDFKSMLQRADQALYISKEAGKNTATLLA
ncbi:MAG: GGDEF domain-containing protein [Sulfurospirillaceae bacterium]|nr:GGDEF domain-containing protein [Sulfurospirillaceae bacterium]